MSGATVEAAIWLALESRLSELPIAYPQATPGKPFEPPQTGNRLDPYFRIGFIMGEPNRPMIAAGKPHWRSGILVVSLVYPMSTPIPSPMAAYNQIAGTVARHFIDGTQMRYGNVCVTVVEYPHVQGGYQENGYWETPVIVPWRCFA